MSFDGQYWHYIDKHLFALLRYAQATGQDKPLQQAEQIIKSIHPRFMCYNLDGSPRGVYWKMNADLTVIPGLEGAGPNDDALAGWIVYSLIREERLKRQQEVGHTVHSPIEHEWREMGQVAAAYVEQNGIRVSPDPLGYGLIAWKSQWMGTWGNQVRSRLGLLAPIALDVQSGMMLPFRLYGALLGARLLPSSLTTTGGEDIKDLAERIVDAVTPIELRAALAETPHSAINKVMLATALDPLAFSRLDHEPTLPLPHG